MLVDASSYEKRKTPPFLDGLESQYQHSLNVTLTPIENHFFEVQNLLKNFMRYNKGTNEVKINNKQDKLLINIKTRNHL